MTASLRPARKARLRLSKVANARDTIAGFGPGMDVVGLTHGQFSLLDLLQATLDITGPADVDIATWSAGLYDVDAARRFVEDGRIRRIRFVMDAGRKNPHQPDTVQIGDLFGHDTIRTCRTHAKFVLISNDEWHVVITSSMNLNLNPRVEQFEMTDDADRHGFFTAWVDEIFDEIPAGGQRRKHDREVPQSPGLDSVQPVTGISNVGTMTIGVFDE
jgi:hypothetical protein